jgi:hypothetical protein
MYISISMCAHNVSLKTNIFMPFFVFFFIGCLKSRFLRKLCEHVGCGDTQDTFCFRISNIFNLFKMHFK